MLPCTSLFVCFIWTIDEKKHTVWNTAADFPPSHSLARCRCSAATRGAKVAEPSEGVAISLRRWPMRIQKYLVIGELRLLWQNNICECMCVWVCVCGCVPEGVVVNRVDGGDWEKHGVQVIGQMVGGVCVSSDRFQIFWVLHVRLSVCLCSVRVSLCLGFSVCLIAHESTTAGTCVFHSSPPPPPPPPLLPPRSVFITSLISAPRGKRRPALSEPRGNATPFGPKLSKYGPRPIWSRPPTPRGPGRAREPFVTFPELDHRHFHYRGNDRDR